MIERGVLRTPPGDAFELRRRDPSPALAAHLAWHWIVSWDLREREPHEQVTVPHPSAHLVVEDGGAWLYGPPRRSFRRTLSGTGRVVGARFRPGALRAPLGRRVAEIADLRLPASALGGLDGDALAAAVGSAAGDDDATAAVEAALAPLLDAAPDPEALIAERAVELAAADRSLARVSQLADRLGLGVRALQRLFAEYVGLGPAGVIRRYRLQEAAAHATAGGRVDWARLAAELGYYDQAHLVRDFTDAVGVPPARYAAAAAAPR